MHLLHNIYFYFFFFFCDCDTVLVGTFINAGCTQNPRPRPPPLCLVCNLTSCPNHSVPRRMMPLAGSLVGFRRYTIHFIPHQQELGEDMTEDLNSRHLRVNSGGPEGIRCRYSPKHSSSQVNAAHNTYTRTTHTHTNTKVPFSHCTARVKYLCAR